MTNTLRAELLRLLIAGAISGREATSRLAVFDWDSDQELVVVTSTDATAQLERFLRGEVDAASVEEWAEAIEGREDIGYEAQSKDVLTGLVFELANPDISGALTPKTAGDWVERLRDG